MAFKQMNSICKQEIKSS